MFILLMFVNRPGFVNLEANVTGHFLRVGILLMLGQISLAARGIAAEITGVHNAQMLALDVMLQRVGPRCGEVTVITWDSFLARLVPVDPMSSKLFGRQRFIFTVLTGQLLGAVSGLGMLVQLKLGLGLERALFTEYFRVGFVHLSMVGMIFL